MLNLPRTKSQACLLECHGLWLVPGLRELTASERRAERLFDRVIAPPSPAPSPLSPFILIILPLFNFLIHPHHSFTHGQDSAEGWKRQGEASVFSSPPTHESQHVSHRGPQEALQLYSYLFPQNLSGLYFGPWESVYFLNSYIFLKDPVSLYISSSSGLTTNTGVKCVNERALSLPHMLNTSHIPGP